MRAAASPGARQVRGRAERGSSARVFSQAALADVERAINDAREIGHAGTLMFALGLTAIPLSYCGRYETATARLDELVALAEEKNTLFWKGLGILIRGYLTCGLRTRRAQGRSRLAVAQVLPLASVLPGHALTGPEHGARITLDGMPSHRS